MRRLIAAILTAGLLISCAGPGKVGHLSPKAEALSYPLCATPVETVMIQYHPDKSKGRCPNIKFLYREEALCADRNGVWPSVWRYGPWVFSGDSIASCDKNHVDIVRTRVVVVYP